jgi:hypothetical protein
MNNDKFIGANVVVDNINFRTKEYEKKHIASYLNH